jgi:hypothetical protein
MAGFSVKVSKTDLAEVERTMTGIKNGYPKVVSRSFNRTITGVRTDSVREIQKVITPKAKTIRSTFTIKKASFRNLRAAVKSTGRPLPLIEYSARATKRGVTVQVKKKSVRTLWPGAFIATMPSGHKGIFSREKPPYRTDKSTKLPWARFPRKFRLKIHEQWGPRVPDIMENAEVIKPILQKAWDRLLKELNHQIDFELNKL